MTAAWAIRFDMRSESGDELASSLGRLRLLADVQTCRVDESNFWVSGPGLDDDVLSLLRSLLCEDRFRVDTDLTLTKLDERTPSGILPAGEWIPIRDFVGLELPVAGVSLPRIPRVPVALIRSSEPAEPRFLLVSSTDAAKWAASASQVPSPEHPWSSGTSCSSQRAGRGVRRSTQNRCVVRSKPRPTNSSCSHGTSNLRRSRNPNSSPRAARQSACRQVKLRLTKGDIRKAAEASRPRRRCFISIFRTRKAGIQTLPS